MTETNETRRQVMLTAWTIQREGRQLRDGRTFGQCLTWAWVAVKREAARAAFSALRMVRLSPSLIRSPLARVFNGRPRGAHRDFQAALTTARIGL